MLPFVNLSADKNDEYLSDGMTEELLNVLTKVKSLRVPGRSSSFAFKGKNEEDIFRKVGEQLHVKARCWKAVCAKRAINCGLPRSSSMWPTAFISGRRPTTAT